MIGCPPVPLTWTRAGDVGAVLVTEIVAFLAPALVGWKRSGSSVVAPGATVIGNDSTCGAMKSAALDEIPVTVTGQLPGFVSISGRSRKPP